jgi:hypothetical protein
MIHLFAICNIETGIGHEIYVNKEEISFKIDPTLLWPLVSALTAFSEEFVSEGKLRSVHLANFQLVMYNPQEEEKNTIPIAYIVLQDIYDNVGYTKTKIEAIDKIMTVFFSSIVDSNFQQLDVIPPTEQVNIREIIQFSQHFPTEITQLIEDEIKRFEVAIGMRFLSLYIADVDEGIIHQFGLADPNERAIFQSFIPIIPTERDLWLEAPREIEKDEMDREGWIIKRIGKNTDFFVMCRFYYSNEIKPYLETLVNKLGSQIYEGIKDQLPERPF